MPSAFLVGSSPEKMLLNQCAHTTVSPVLAESIRSKASGNIDCDRLLVAASEHSMVPLLNRNLRGVAPDSLHAAQKEQLNTAARNSAFRGLKLTAELVKVLGAFEAQKSLALPYKGPVVAMQAYGDLSLRPFEDVDILVPQRDMPKAHEVMLALGYQSSLSWLAAATARDFPAAIPGEYKYYSAERDAIVEIHTERTLRHFPIPPDLDDFARHGVKISLSGREILTLCPEDALLALCVHGAKDFWARLIWVADISEMIQAYPQLDWDRLWRRAESLRAQRMMSLGLLLARQVLGARIPRDGKLVRDDQETFEMVKHFTRELFAREGQPWSAAERFAFRRRCVPGYVAGWRYALRLTTAPAQDDLEMVRLPRYLQPLYTLLRPLRLLRKYREVH
jgi:hypothetical protein